MLNFAHKSLINGAEETDQWLGAHVDLAEDLHLVPSIHTRPPTTAQET